MSTNEFPYARVVSTGIFHPYTLVGSSGMAQATAGQTAPRESLGSRKPQRMSTIQTERALENFLHVDIIYTASDEKNPQKSRILLSLAFPGGKMSLVRPRRFERLTYSFGGCCSIQLSYGRLKTSRH